MSKRYGGAVALDDVDLTVEAGEIHALLGPNGAGKSTLIRCITGGVAPDEGEIVIDDLRFSALTPREARRAGVGTVHQHLSLIDTLDVTDNIFLGCELRRGPLRRRAAQRRAAGEALELVGAREEIAVDAQIGDLSVPQRQLVEIAKVLRRGGIRVLILDEPTAALTDVEAQGLAERLRALRAQGLHIIYTTHFIDEVFALADRLTVLRDGRAIVRDTAVADTTPSAVIDAIAGERGQSAVARPRMRARMSEAPMLELEELSGPRFGPISLEVRPGEIVGLFGLLGSGRTELLETIFGARRPTAGAMRFDGRALPAAGPARAIERGLALVPGDRLRQGIFASLSARDNVVLPSVGGFARGGLRDVARERSVFDAMARGYRLRPPRGDALARELSGGNAQKLVVGRWLAALDRTRLVLLDEPTQGIDIGARHDIYEILRATAAEGKGVIFTSSDPDEVVAAADRALVLRRGRVVAELSGRDLSESALLDISQTAEVAA
nr:sugar ABC transporter ATP-binding protein [Conexibacter arvalis]